MGHQRGAPVWSTCGQDGVQYGVQDEVHNDDHNKYHNESTSPPAGCTLWEHQGFGDLRS